MHFALQTGLDIIVLRSCHYSLSETSYTFTAMIMASSFLGPLAVEPAYDLRVGRREGNPTNQPYG